MNIKEFHGRRNENGSTEVFVVYDDRPPQPLINHAPVRSPDGFEWGYGGSGPFALAKSILHEIDPKLADQIWLVDAFKWNIIAAIFEDEWTLTIEQIENFIARKTSNIN